MKRTYRIYLITNLVNGKFYVGRTIKTLKKRWQEHISFSKRPKYAINFAIAKYKPENFKIELIEDNLDFKGMVERESFYIKKYDSINPNKGYNLVITDSNGGYEFISESTLKKHSISAHNRKRHNQSKHGAGIAYKPKEGTSPWLAYLCKSGKWHSKYFKSKEEAVEWRDLLSCYFHGKNANLNNPLKKDYYLSQDLDTFFKNFISSVKIAKNNFFGVIVGTRDGIETIRASIKVDQKPISLGCFDTEEAAAIAYDKVKWFLTQDAGAINFPENIPIYETLDLKAFFESFSKKKPKLDTRFNGIYLDKKRQFWISKSVFKFQEYRAKFDNEILAAENYDKLQLSFYGAKAKLNFPEKAAVYQNEINSGIFDASAQKAVKKEKSKANYIGVFIEKGCKKWNFHIVLTNKTRNVRRGFFTPQAAAFHRDVFILNNCHLLNKTSRLNFPIASMFHAVLNNPQMEIQNVV